MTEEEEQTLSRSPVTQSPEQEDQPAQIETPPVPTPTPQASSSSSDLDTPPSHEEIDPIATIHVPIPIAIGEEAVSGIISPASSSPQVEQTQIAPPPRTLPSMDIDDLLALNMVSDPQISPDGIQIAFTLQHNNVEQDRSETSIFVVNSAGGKAHLPRQISAGRAHDSQPRWSPDGQSLAFLSDRSGTQQLYLLSMAGGEARQISALAQDITEYSWHPGSRMLLAHSRWRPADDHEELDASSQTSPLFSTSTHVDEYRNTTGTKQNRYLQLWLIPLEGKVTRLTSEPVNLVQSCWSPDGTAVAFCANRRADPDLSNSMALWVLTLATGQLRLLSPEEGWAQMPSWSPDGQWIAYLYTSDLTRSSNIAPWLVAAQGDATPQPAVQNAETLNCQCWIIDELRTEMLARPQWSANSQALLVPVNERGQVHLYRLDRTTDSYQRLTNGNGRYLSPHLSRNGQTITLIRADWFTPGDVWCMDSDGSHLRKLTRINDVILQSHQLTRPRRITWQSFDGLEIEGWLYLPALAEQAKAPLILAPHGGPSYAWGDSYVHEFQVLASHGYAVLAPNFRGSTGYGDDFGRKHLNDWGGADLRDCMTGIDYVIAHEPIDEQRLGLNGISHGGYLVNWTITQNNRFKAAVSRNSVSSLESVSLLSASALWYSQCMSDPDLRRERSPLTYVEQVTTPVLLLHAEEDVSCPINEAQQFFVALRRQKKTVELVRYHEASHMFDWPGVGTPRQRVDRLRRTLEWFRRFL